MGRTSGILALGIDVGGTKTALGVVDCATGRSHRSVTLATPQPKASAAFLSEVAAAAFELDPKHALPIGLGLCELVTGAGTIASNWRINWQSTDVHAAFKDWPSIAIDADVRAAARAEAAFGAGRGLSHWIFANAGTGIACCLMVNGKPHVGASGLGMAWGMSPADTTSNAGGPSIEDCSGGAALLAKAKSVGLTASSVGELSALADGGSAEAQALLAEGGAVLGRGLGTLANMLDPEAIILGGGLALASAEYRSALVQGIAHSLWPKDRTMPRVLTAGNGAAAGVTGAALFGCEASLQSGSPTALHVTRSG
jgi:glucokinase